MPVSLSWGYKRVYDSVNYRLRTTAGGRFALRCRPSSIIILLSEICNARCVRSDIWRNTDREDSASSETWKKILTDMRRWLGPIQVPFSDGLFQEILTHG